MNARLPGVVSITVFVLIAAAVAQGGNNEHNTKNNFIVLVYNDKFGLYQFARELGNPAASTVDLTFLHEQSDQTPVTLVLQDITNNLLVAGIVKDQTEDGKIVPRRGETLGTAQMEVFMGEMETKELYNQLLGEKEPYNAGVVFFELFTPFKLEGRKPVTLQLIVKIAVEYTIKASNEQLGERSFRIVMKVKNLPCNDLPRRYAPLLYPQVLSTPMDPIDDIHEKVWYGFDHPGMFSPSSEKLISNLISIYPPLEMQLLDMLDTLYGLQPSQEGLNFDLDIAEIKREDEFRAFFMVVPGQQSKKETLYHIGSGSFSNNVHIERDKYGPGKDAVDVQIESYGIEPAFFQGSVNAGYYDGVAAVALNAPICEFEYGVVA